MVSANFQLVNKTSKCKMRVQYVWNQRSQDTRIMSNLKYPSQLVFSHFIILFLCLFVHQTLHLNFISFDLAFYKKCGFFFPLAYHIKWGESQMQSELPMFDKGHLHFFFKFDFKLSLKIHFIHAEILIYHLVRHCCARTNF